MVIVGGAVLTIGISVVVVCVFDYLLEVMDDKMLKSIAIKVVGGLIAVGIGVAMVYFGI